ncbi:TFIIB-type zinc ribbon-containing protein [Halorubrum halodurans]|uniref:Uncharacterized protein n=1 Tax=Halorubrum halodurans TaxID=1383851 RepID=A0A256IKL9_9EURY|nr:zf-TFIIB domain-containing protein [Halorubrum halodurans]OYR57074.1 hypothetical protein DJ70_06655 [Halorubrum halodurans]
MSTECPRCGSELTTFTLGGAEAVGCDACGYAGVEVDHSGEPRLVESWEEALERFGRNVDEREETDDEEEVGDEDEEAGDDEAGDDEAIEGKGTDDEEAAGDDEADDEEETDREE